MDEIERSMWGDPVRRPLGHPAETPTFEEMADALADLLDHSLHLSRGGEIAVDGNRVGICDQCGNAWPCPQAHARNLLTRAGLLETP